MIDTALAAHPAADVAPWFHLARAQALITNQSGTAALDVVIPLTEDPNPRVRYEATLLAAEALGLCHRIEEARDQLRTAEDIARRTLYADSGVDAAIPASRHDAIGRTDEERLWRDAESARGRKEFKTALGNYRELLSRFPAGRWRHVAVVQAGWCLVGLQQVAEGEKLWSSFIQADPTGPWRGRALVALVDVALEERGDPALAESRCQTLESGLSAPGVPAPTAPDSGDPGEGWMGVAREAQLRRILLLLVAGDHVTARARAVALLAEGSPVDRVRTLVTDSPWYTPASGVGRLLEALARGQAITPQAAVIRGKDQANLHLLLADVFILLEIPDRADAHLSVVLAGLLSATPNQRVYATMRQGDMAYAAGHFDLYRTTYADCLTEAPRNPWAATQSLYLAVDAFSRRKNENQRSLPRNKDLCQGSNPVRKDRQSPDWVLRFCRENQGNRCFIKIKHQQSQSRVWRT